jgi:hypothetical protein
MDEDIPNQITNEDLNQITRDDILNAISALDRGESNAFGPSTSYDLLESGKQYPPKAVIGLAARRALGRSLRPDEFSSGQEKWAFRLLQDRGFTIVDKDKRSNRDELPNEPPPHVWIEDTKTSSHGHGGAGWEFGTCLWSPSSNKISHDQYALMREPNTDDLVIHINDGELVGWSYVSTPYHEVTNEPPSPGPWAGRKSYYRIDLKGYREFARPLPLTTFIEKHHTALKEELKNDQPKHYPFILYRGKAVRHGQGAYLTRCTQKLYGLIRPEMSIAMENQAAASNLTQISNKPNEAMAPTNLIIYGPPGTGKTYSTIAEAVKLCDGTVPEGGAAAVKARFDTLMKAKRIAFVTFHQSYSYEDFIMGLRPETAEADGNVGFSLVPTPGVFYQIAEAARANRGATLPGELVKLNKDKPVFKMSLGDTSIDEGTTLFRECIDGNYVLLGWGDDVDWRPSEYDDLEAIRERWHKNNPGASDQDANIKLLNRFRNLMKEGDLVIISLGNKKIRAIGEIRGPYQYVPRKDQGYRHRRQVSWLWQDSRGLPREQIYSKGLSQLSIYQMDSEDIEWEALEQIVAGGETINSKIGVPEPYVIVIDEINRADVSKVFGELITLLEPDKRLGMKNALTVTLPYSNDQFGVPANLHVVGTMNTADRSIALIDTGLRRRFQFKELMPDPSKLGIIAGVNLDALLNSLNARIEFFLDRDHQIGHAYFMDCTTRDDIEGVMRHKVIPLLVEYFYEDWSKIWRVLGEPEQGEGAFLRREKLSAPKGGDELELDSERWRYSVRQEFAPEAYTQLTK